MNGMQKDLSLTRISEIMTGDVIVLRPGENMNDACRKMRTHNIRHLPVVDDAGRLKGLFTDRDLNRAYSPRETETGWYYSKSELELLSLRHFMTKEPHCLTPDHTLKDAAKIMASHKYGCIPIAHPESGKLAGILSYIDVLKYLIS